MTAEILLLVEKTSPTLLGTKICNNLSLALAFASGGLSVAELLCLDIPALMDFAIGIE